MAGFLKTATQWTFDTKNGSIQFIVRTTAVTYLVVFTLTIPVLILVPESFTNEWDGSYTSFVVLALLAAPLFENLVLVGLIEFLDAIECKDKTIIIITAVLSGAVHAIGDRWQFIVGLGFASMTYGYLIHRKKPFSKRYFITVAQHVLLNTPATLMMGWSEI